MSGCVWAPSVSGPLVEHGAGFERWLRARGFSRSAVSQRNWQFDHLSRWLEREGLRPDQLTPARQEQFLAARRAAGYRTWVSRAELEGAACVSARGRGAGAGGGGAGGPLERLLDDYRLYLARERGLAPSTVEITNASRGCSWPNASRRVSLGSAGWPQSM